MADDDGGDWFAATDDEPPPVIKPIKKKGAVEEPPPSQEAPASAADGGEAPAEEKREEAADEEYLDPNKLLLFKHWIRPKFLPYKCLYDYRRNYYDDVLEVLASRRRGIKRDIPKAQTWAERMVRLTGDPLYKLDKFDQFLNDIRFVTKLEINRNVQTYNVKTQFNKRYSKLLF